MTDAAVSLSLAGAPTGASADLSDPQAESRLSDVSEAYSEWTAAKDRADRYRSILVEMVLDARRDGGAKLADIAAAMGVTRQMVQKIIREAEAGEDEAAAYAARYDPDNARRALGKTGGYSRPQCGGCKRFLKAHGAQCPSCGYLDGGGYFAVPAQTSHLERWR